MSTSPERPLGGQDPYAPKRSREQEQTRPQAVGKLSRGESDDGLDDEPVGLHRIQVVAPPPLVGPAPHPRPDAPGSITARDIALVAIVSLLSGLAVIAFYRFADVPQAPAPQLASASATRMI